MQDVLPPVQVALHRGPQLEPELPGFLLKDGKEIMESKHREMHLIYFKKADESWWNRGCSSL